MRYRPLQESELSAYLDGELGPEEAAEIEARLEGQPEASRRFEELAADKEALSRALETLDPPVENLRTASLERKLARSVARTMDPQPRVLTWGVGRFAVQTAAACALVAFGWWGHAALEATSGSIPEFVSEAVGAHDVFAEDTERPVEFTGASVHTVSDWFSQKLGVPVTAPDLTNRGMALVGARLLGTKEGPLVQYVYEDGDGGRISLTLAKHPENQPVYAMRVVDYPDSTVGYWSKGEIDYALVAKARYKAVQSIAEDVAQDI